MPDPEPAPSIAEPRARTVHPVRRGLLSLSIVVVYGVIGYVAAGWTLADGLYMVVITISSVGFGEVRPITYGWLRAHTMIVIVAGMVAVGFTLAGILRFVAED